MDVGSVAIMLLVIAAFIGLICLAAWSFDHWIRSLIGKTPDDGRLKALDDRDALIVETLAAALESRDWAMITDLIDELRDSKSKASTRKK